MIPTGPDSLVSLPRQGGVAYHAQESWVLNETIRVRFYTYFCRILDLCIIRITSYLARHMTSKGTTPVCSCQLYFRWPTHPRSSA